MKSMERIKTGGPIGAARHLWKDGQGKESNPYTEGTPDHKIFNLEMQRLEQQEFIDMMGGRYVH